MFTLTETPIDAAAAVKTLQDPAAGAAVTFEGWVRNHNASRDVTRLDYEAYPEMAIQEGRRILEESCERFDILNAICIHRTGSLAIGDMAVWVGVASVHRGPAFEACELIIDTIKTRVPIWKKETYADGNSGWVACHACGATVADSR